MAAAEVPVEPPTGGGGGGGGGGGDPAPTATPNLATTFWAPITGQYSYDNSAMFCDGRDPRASEVDPITLVGRYHYHSFLRWVATYSTVTEEGSTEEERWSSGRNHLLHHSWSDSNDRGQFFRELLGCVEGEISLSDPRFDPTRPLIEQWHARGHQNDSARDPFTHGRPVNLQRRL